jgi:hypothetical protein
VLDCIITKYYYDYDPSPFISPIPLLYIAQIENNEILTINPILKGNAECSSGPLSS